MEGKFRKVGHCTRCHGPIYFDMVMVCDDCMRRLVNRSVPRHYPFDHDTNPWQENAIRDWEEANSGEKML